MSLTGDTKKAMTGLLKHTCKTIVYYLNLTGLLHSSKQSCLLFNPWAHNAGFITESRHGNYDWTDRCIIMNYIYSCENIYDLPYMFNDNVFEHTKC